MSVEVQGLNLNITAKSDIGQTAAQIKALSDAMRNLKVSQAKSEALGSLAKSLNAFALAVNKVDANKLSGFAGALKSLSDIKVSTSASTSIKKLVDSLNELDARKFYGQINALNRTLQPLAQTLKTLADASKGIKLNATLGKGAARAADALQKEQDKLSIPGITKSPKETDKAKEKIYSIGQAISHVNKKISESDTGKFFDAIKKDAKVAANAILTVGHAFDTVLKYSVKLGKGLASVVSTASRIGFLNPFKGFADSISNATKRLGNLYKSLKRIFMYRMIRTVIKEITQGIQEGVTNLYNWSKLTGEDMYRFRNTMDSLSTSALYLKNSLGAMVSPILNMLAPAVDYAVDRFVELLNTINQVLARIAGQASWTAAIKYPKQFADAVGGASKKIKDNIQDFDELHILRTPNGGGGAAAEDYSKMFEEKTFENGVFAWAQSLRDAIKQGEWAQAGVILGQQLNKVLDGIDSEKLGKKFASKLNKIFTFGYSFLKTTDFSKIGGGVASFLNNALDDLNTYQIGQTLARKWTAIFDFLYEFVTTFDFKRFGTKVSEYVEGWFAEIDGHKIGVTLSNAIKGIFDFGLSFFSNEDMRRNFIEDINGFFAGLDWNEIHFKGIDLASKFTDWFKNSMNELDTASIGTSISEGLHTALDMAITFIDEGGLDSLVDGLIDIINHIDWKNALLKGLYIGAKIGEALLDVIIGALTGETVSGEAYISPAQIDTSYSAWKAGTYTGNTYLTDGTTLDSQAFGDRLVTGISTSVTSTMNTEKLATAFKSLLEKAWEAAIKVAEFITDPIAEKVSEVYNIMKYGYTNEGEDASDVRDIAIEEMQNSGNPIMQMVGSHYAAQRHIQEKGWGEYLFSAFASVPRAIGAGLGVSKGITSDEMQAAMQAGVNIVDEDALWIWVSEYRKNQGQAQNNSGLLAHTSGRQAMTSEGLAAFTSRHGYGKQGNIANQLGLNDLITNSKKMSGVLKDNTTAMTNFGIESEESIGKASTAWDNFGTEISVDGANKVAGTTSNISAMITSLSSDVTSTMGTLGSNVVTSITNTSKALVTPLDTVKTQISTAYQGAGSEAIASLNNFAPQLQGALSTVAGKTAEGLSGISGIWDSFKSSVSVAGNATIGVAETVANGVIDAYNALKLSIGGIMESIKNAFSNDPQGSKAMNVSFPTMSKINIPRLAEGGIVTSPVNALIGEAGREAVLPLDNNTGWLDMLSERMGNSEDTELLREQNDLLRELLAKKTGITSREVFDAVRQENQEYFVRTGTNALVM